MEGDRADSGFDVRGPARFDGLPRAVAIGRVVPVASTRRARALGLALLDRSRCGPGLLIPDCSSVHTFGMRFAIDVLFLDRALRPLAVASRVPPRRIVARLGAGCVLELPSAESAGRCR